MWQDASTFCVSQKHASTNMVLGTHFFGTDISTCSGRKAFRGGSKSLAHRCSLGHGSSVVMSEMVQVMKERKTAGM